MNKSRIAERRTVVLALLAGISLSGKALAADRYVPTQYATIQAAVNAAQAGDTVRIAAGDYREQVLITNKTALTLVGEPGTVLRATTGMTRTLPDAALSLLFYPVLGLYRTEVVISGIDFEGEQLADAYTGNKRFVGILFLGASGLVTNCTVRGFRGPGPDQAYGAFAFQCYNPVNLGSPKINVHVLDSSFADNEYAIYLRGDPLPNPTVLRATATIQGNSITGLEPSSIDNFGIWLVAGVDGEVVGNRISDEYQGIAAYDAAAQTHGRFIPLQRVNYQGNTFSNNVMHLRLIGGNDTTVLNNMFVGTGTNPPDLPGLVLSGTNIVAANNNFSERPLGIRLVSNESWPSPWPPLPPAASVKLVANWFCKVPMQIQISDPSKVTDVDEQGTETWPFRLRFQGCTKTDGGEVRLVLRGWHGDSLVIEASTNLQDWLPVQTNAMTLPTFEYQDMNGDGAPHRFYRAVRP